MGMFDKIKSLFYDEEIIEVPKENLKDEIKNSNIALKEIDEVKKDAMDDIISERDLVKKDTNFKFPVIFEDEDFVEVKKIEKKVEEKKSYSRVDEQRNKYKRPTLDREVIKEVIEKPKKFKPSPVISPVYGVLDKNYKKDEDKNSKDLEQTKELVINFDTIRQKAYGSLSDEIENELDHKTNKIDEIEKEIDNILVENNLLTDLEDDMLDSTEITTVEDDNDEYSYSDFGVEYKISEDTKFSKEEDMVQEAKTVELNEEKDENKEKQVELTEDLFNLIDSMYDR